MKTQIFKTYQDFLKREDKSVNGVSPEFAKENPNYEVDNKSNIGCWNCRSCTECKGCMACKGCQECFECYGCGACDGCTGCKRCKWCEGCKNIVNESNLIDVQK